MASIAHFGWNPVGKVNYEDAFQTMRLLKLPYPDQEQQYRRMIFNAVTKNTDDHVKNISYMLEKDGAWQLSPAYDVTFTYNPEELLGDRYKMKINGRQKEFTMDDFLEVADNMEIKRADDIIDQVLKSVEKWPDFAKRADVRSDITEYIANHHLDGEQLDPGLSITP